jgi:TRAP-type C4-dicarboxylate transport system permease small subunit
MNWWTDLLPPAWRKATVILAAFGAVALFVMMLVTLVDIVGRSLGLINIQGVIELSRIMVVLIGFFGLARCFSIDGHIVVDLFTQGMSRRKCRVLDAFWIVVSAVFLGIVLYYVLLSGVELHDSGERSENLGWSPLVFHLAAVIGGAIGCVTAVWIGLRALARAAQGREI